MFYPTARDTGPIPAKILKILSPRCEVAKRKAVARGAYRPVEIPNARHLERSGSGKAGGTQSKDPVEVTSDDRCGC